MATVLRDKPFYDRSGGGITLSGGEPFMNPDRRTPCLKPAMNKAFIPPLKPAFTSPRHYIEPSLPYVDLFLGGPEACGQ